ncbi:hypothetical protein [Vibrio alginolyticus]|uniref:hypothetical protein n=1 Tax=Vibrio alginolyticus TaxID=663 RepID=UPI0015F5D9A2|nr:hypothetical protein [Vibrio alginolyticus]
MNQNNVLASDIELSDKVIDVIEDCGLEISDVMPILTILKQENTLSHEQSELSPAVVTMIEDCNWVVSDIMPIIAAMEQESMATDYFDSLNESEQQVWGLEPVFKPVSEWTEEDGQALFFRLDVGEPPAVTSPISSDWDGNYYTHWMKLPEVFCHINEYRAACIRSGVETSQKAIQGYIYER